VPSFRPHASPAADAPGVPIRLEVGPRDLAKGVAVAAQRATGKKVEITLAELTTSIPVSDSALSC
jgi:prolyl-tRNA synthetase